MEKSPFIKNSPEIKSCQFETLFSRTFFWLQYDFIQKSPRKKSSKSENAWFTILDFSFPRIYFLQDFFQRSYFLRLYWQPPYYFRGKKSQESKTPDFISSDFFSKDLRKFGLFLKFLFPGFFPETFFPGLSYIDSKLSFSILIETLRYGKDDMSYLYILFYQG